MELHQGERVEVLKLVENFKSPEKMNELRIVSHLAKCSESTFSPAAPNCGAPLLINYMIVALDSDQSSSVLVSQ